MRKFLTVYWFAALCVTIIFGFYSAHCFFFSALCALMLARSVYKQRKIR